MCTPIQNLINLFKYNMEIGTKYLEVCVILEYQDLGLHNLYKLKGIENINSLVEHLWMGTTTGKLFPTSMTQLKIEIWGIRILV